MDKRIDNMKYEKLLIDNATCKRRFHLVFETGAKNDAHVEIKCPHCGVVLFNESKTYFSTSVEQFMNK